MTISILPKVSNITNFDSPTSAMAVTAKWTRLLADDALPRSSQTLTVVGDTAYVFGGEVKPREPVDSIVYHVSAKPGQSLQNVSSVSTGKTAPQARVGAATTTLGSKIYVFSGRGGTAMAPIEENGSFWVFDTSDKTWSQLQPNDAGAACPVGRSYHTLTNDGKDTIFAHAGCPEKGRKQDLWSFNIHQHEWQELTPAPGPERGGTSITYAHGKLYRMNGFDGKTEQGGALDVFDIASNQWSTIHFEPDGISGPTPRSVGCLVAVSVDKKPSLVTMFGERDPSSLGHAGAGKMLCDIWLFDIESQTWKEVHPTGDTPSPRGWFDADAYHDTGVVVHGGLAESNARIGDLWLLAFD
ncbi:hypothetical protein PV11_01657 [Exophiala sideris]|uniref:Nitrile-specifier protein 5 n=1 Tax=Exophiala sideris TaxID=1016849 RepID=A0A0D1YWY9_9EURO|nr:hypothetical protein PV11_01657 [Exophiala sideris]